MHNISADEATFNRHNFHYRDTENPHRFQQAQSQFRWSLKVWGAMLGDGVIRPGFFNTSLNGRDCIFLQTELTELLKDNQL